MVAEYEEWFDDLEPDLQDALSRDILVLETIGPTLSRPYSDSINGSKLNNLKELRTKHKGKPYRSLYVFDPDRSAILLVGGNKASKGKTKKWYNKNIKRAEKRYKRYFKEEME